jgi:CBS domain-containing protein
MRVFEVMTEGVETVAPTLPASDAWELMKRKGIRHLVVTLGADVVGVLSERDTGSRLGARARAGHTVADFMTSPVVTVARTDTLRSVANVMRGRTIGCAPVIEGKRLIGIVTVTDLLEALGRGIDRPVPGTRPIATHRTAHRKQSGAVRAW